MNEAPLRSPASRNGAEAFSDLGRAFIGNFSPEIQEMIAYKNAEDIIAKYAIP